MLVCAFLCATLHTRPRVQRAPGIPCSLFFRGTTKCKARAIMPRECGVTTVLLEIQSKICEQHWSSELQTIPVILRACDAFGPSGALEQDGNCSSRQMAV